VSVQFCIVFQQMICLLLQLHCYTAHGQLFLWPDVELLPVLGEDEDLRVHEDDVDERAAERELDGAGEVLEVAEELRALQNTAARVVAEAARLMPWSMLAVARGEPSGGVTTIESMPSGFTPRLYAPSVSA